MGTTISEGGEVGNEDVAKDKLEKDGSIDVAPTVSRENLVSNFIFSGIKGIETRKLSLAFHPTAYKKIYNNYINVVNCNLFVIIESKSTDLVKTMYLIAKLL